MRKVMFKQWIPAIHNKEAVGSTLQAGTNCWEAEFKNAGIFHQWGASYEEFESGAGNFTVALVELPNGEMKEVLPSNIKFMDFPNYTTSDLRTDDATKTE